MTYKQRYEKALKIFAEEQDKRDKYMQMLKDFYIRNGIVPPGHEQSFAIGKSEKFTPWRQQPKVVKRIKKAARKAARNEGRNQ